MERRRILVIAGSDSSGGAGVEADQRVIAHHLCYAMTATTALTAQNTQGVSAIHHIPQDFVVQQIDMVFEDVGVDVVKIGMLASAETVDAVGEALGRHGIAPLVLDPVMVSTSGAQLLPDGAVRSLGEKLLPLATVLTPNIPEGHLLLRNAGIEPPEINSVADLVDIAKSIQRLGPKYVLLKGGHLPFNKSGEIAKHEADHRTIMNIFHNGEEAVVLETDYIASKNTHGTGCSLASAIASQMVLSPNLAVTEQVKAACQYVEMGIKTGADWKLGKGSGPINHFHSDSEKASLKMYTYEEGKQS